MPREFRCDCYEGMYQLHTLQREPRAGSRRHLLPCPDLQISCLQAQASSRHHRTCSLYRSVCQTCAHAYSCTRLPALHAACAEVACAKLLPHTTLQPCTQALSPTKVYRHPDGSLQGSPPAPDPLTVVHSAAARAQTELPMQCAEASDGVCAACRQHEQRLLSW